MATSSHGTHVRVVTLSASYGAGGSLIAPALAERLDVPFADRLIAPTDVASGESLTETEREQSARGGFLARLALVSGGLGLPVPAIEDGAEQVRMHVEATITDFLEKGGGVLLGRAGAVVLSAEPLAFHVRLDGPPERRLTQALVIERVDAQTARSRLAETDRARARYVHRLYGQNVDDPHRYHLILDATVLSPAACVEVIAGAANAFWDHRASTTSG